MAEEPKTNPSTQPTTDNLDTTRIWAERWLSPKRLAPYLTACGGEVERALDLYEWNISLGQVLMRDVSHFEVALRNAYDRVMGERWEGAHWLLDEGSPVLRPIVRMSKIPYLNAAWPRGTDRNDLNRALAAINRVRNRVAHSERLFDPLTEALSPARADADIIRVLRALCPEAAERLYGDGGRTPVELFCEEHPAPADVRL